MSKRKPTSSQPGIDRYFCKSRRTESPVDEGEKTANDGDQQTLAIPTPSNSTACVNEGNKTAETPKTKLTNFLEWHPTDSSHMLLKRTGSQGAIRVL